MVGVVLPFIKWVGGKRQILPELVKSLPKTFNTYYEPFVGGGALFFYLLSKKRLTKAVISDTNKELMITYIMIRDFCLELMSVLQIMELAHNKNFYLSIRNLDRNEVNQKISFSELSNVVIAARFLYMNKAGFNGVYRVNKNNQNNVPFNYSSKVNTFDKRYFVELSTYLKSKNILIYCKHYRKSVHKAKSGDFVYFDPPYDLLNKSTFDQYGPEKFGIKGQIELSRLCTLLDKKGVKFMVSNHDTPLIRDLYNNPKFRIKIVEAKRLINSDGSKRGAINEVLVTNYE